MCASEMCMCVCVCGACICRYIYHCKNRKVILAHQDVSVEDNNDIGKLGGYLCFQEA